MIDSQVLKEFRLFDGLDDSKLSEIAEISNKRSRKTGAFCFVQGEKATEVNLCRSGQVHILIHPYEPSGTEIKVHTVEAGEVFGWSALLGPSTYTTFAMCVGNVEEVYIKGSDLLNILERNPHTGVGTNLICIREP